jgi:pimeloyl-ACP methyl ester carboxylesterase
MANIGGRSLNIEVSGLETAPAVVLLHHGLGSTRAWRRQVLALVEAGWRVINYDRWGYGGSDIRNGIDIPWFEDDQADLRMVMDAYGVESAALVGHSDGGTIGLYFAACHPQRVTKLATIAAHIYVEPEMLTGVESARQRFETDTVWRESLQRAHGEKYAKTFYNWYDGWTSPGARLELEGWDMRPALGQITADVLAVQGEADEFASPEHARRLAESLPRAQLWLEPGAGHSFPQDRAEVFNRRLLEFLAE